MPLPARAALVTGVSGQDGAYLAAELLRRGYVVLGTTRSRVSSEAPLYRLGLDHQVSIATVDFNDEQAVAKLLEEFRPDEIYHLAGQSSVGHSFESPAETVHGIVTAVQTILAAVARVDAGIRVFHASSGEIFGDTGGKLAHEDTQHRPVSPYGIAKAAAHRIVDHYRQSFGLFAVNGVLFNHESPLRGKTFVTRKIVKSVLDIVTGRAGTLSLGDTSVVRDWGWAPEFVSGMVDSLGVSEPTNFVFATGRPIALAEFVAEAFAAVQLDWRSFVETDFSLARPSELQWSGGDPTRAYKVLSWTANCHGRGVARAMVRAEMDHRARIGEEPSAAI